MRIKKKNRFRKMSFYLKCGIFVFVCLFLVLNVNFVDAGDYDSAISKNRKEGIYATAYLNGVNHLYYLNMYTMNGRVAYCLEIGVDVSTDIYHSTNDFGSISLTEEQSRYVKNISYFGYLYPGHEDYKYYMAAQELIWEYLSNIEVQWTNILDFNGPRIDIEGYKQDILNLYKNAEKGISLEKVGNLKLNKEYVINEVNSYLNNYEIVETNNVDAFIENNTIKLKTRGDYIGKASIVLKKKGIYNYGSKFYYYDNSQKLISVGDLEDDKVVVTVNIVGSNLLIKVVDKDTGLSNPQGEATLKDASYSLYDENNKEVGGILTDINGVSYLLNLPYGKYYIKQNRASVGYVKNNDIYEFVFDEDEEEVILYQQVITNNIKFFKTYGQNNGKIKVEAGVNFVIYDSFNNIYKKIVTDEEGVIFIELPYGNYLVHQENTVKGYKMIEDFSIKVKDNIEEIINYNLFDEAFEYSLKLKVKNMVTGDNILNEGFAFKVKDKSSGDYISDFSGDIFFTNQNGELLFPMKFIYGEYVIEQVGVAKNYLLNKEKLELVIDEHTSFLMVDGNLIAEVAFYNQLIMGRVNVESLQEIFNVEAFEYCYKKEILENVEFDLVASKDIVVDNKIIYKNGEKVNSFVTNEKGKFRIDNLYLGDYCLEAFFGVKNCFSLVNDNNEIGIIDKNVEIIKLINKGDVLIYNVSSSGEVIEGTMMEVFDDKGNVILNAITNQDGIIKVGNIPFGSYCVLEKKINDNYFLDEKSTCFVVNEKKKDVYITNKQKKNMIISVPDTFSNKKNVWNLIIVILVLIVIGGFLYKKVFNIDNNL